ncbi:hypothetical protein, partial [Actinoplanes subglobosus]
TAAAVTAAVVATAAVTAAAVTAAVVTAAAVTAAAVTAAVVATAAAVTAAVVATAAAVTAAVTRGRGSGVVGDTADGVGTRVCAGTLSLRRRRESDQRAAHHCHADGCDQTFVSPHVNLPGEKLIRAYFTTVQDRQSPLWKTGDVWRTKYPEVMFIQ